VRNTGNSSDQTPRQQPAQRRIIKGKGNSSSTSIKAIPRQLHAFVSRLAADTTEQDLTDWLAGVGIVGAVCRKITPKDGHVFNTAAFKVSCESRFGDIFYNE